ncbi:hypothetical protein LCGC14_0392450 [marine sediment metagenome]|uniref:Uncharacterized protein n=1 Tax=marine sediment metagenome TaxID=412755 RepID=A0A0F9VLG0_9ZZZZ
MGQYAVEKDLTDAYGTINIRDWSNRDNQSTSIDTATVDVAVRRGESEINNQFRRGIYAIPFSFSDTDAQETVKEWNVVLAVWWLFKFRKVNSQNNPKEPRTNFLKDDVARVRAEMKDYLSGQLRRLNAAFVEDDHPTAPVFVT